MDNAGDRKDIRRREKQAKVDAAQRGDVIRNIMSTTTGRMWLWDVLSTCGIFTSTFTGDGLQSAFLEGKRAVGLALLSDIMTHCPEQYIQAQREANVRSTTDERRSGPVGNGGDSGSSDPDSDPDTYAYDDGISDPDPFDDRRRPGRHDIY